MTTQTELTNAYALSNSWEREQRRLQLLEELLDPLTFARVGSLPVAPGWRCLEVGAGLGSVTRWLCDRVGSAGWVLATDIDPRFVETIHHPALEVRCHDIRVDGLPAGGFDLIHTRAVLEHLPERNEIIGRLVEALRPGGWLVIEDFDEGGVGFTGPESYRQAMEAMLGQLSACGADFRWARHLGSRFADHGLVDIRVEGQILFTSGSSPVADLLELTWGQLFGDVEDDNGTGGRSVFRAALAALRDPGTWASLPVVIGAVGRLPASPATGSPPGQLAVSSGAGPDDPR